MIRRQVPAKSSVLSANSGAEQGVDDKYVVFRRPKGFLCNAAAQRFSDAHSTIAVNGKQIYRTFPQSHRGWQRPSSC
jgi:hypothetical protein